MYKKKGVIIELIDEYTAKVKVEKYTVKIDQVRFGYWDITLGWTTDHHSKERRNWIGY